MDNRLAAAAGALLLTGSVAGWTAGARATADAAETAPAPAALVERSADGTVKLGELQAADAPARRGGPPRG